MICGNLSAFVSVTGRTQLDSRTLPSPWHSSQKKSDSFVVLRSRRFIPAHEELVCAAILGYLALRHWKDRWSIWSNVFKSTNTVNGATTTCMLSWKDPAWRHELTTEMSNGSTEVSVIAAAGWDREHWRGGNWLTLKWRKWCHFSVCFDRYLTHFFNYWTSVIFLNSSCSLCGAYHISGKAQSTCESQGTLPSGRCEKRGGVVWELSQACACCHVTRLPRPLALNPRSHMTGNNLPIYSALIYGIQYMDGLRTDLYNYQLLSTALGFHFSEIILYNAWMS
jgi:hypothetical protein